MPDTETITFHYLNQFQCLGAQCSDHCCGGWRVALQREAYDRLQQAMTEEDAERARFSQYVRVCEASDATAERYAMIELREDGNCPFLDADGLCHIHRRYGEDFLPDTCGNYPRERCIVGAKVLMGAAISCPEVARLCLSAEDATELVSLHSQHQRVFAKTVIRSTSGDPYEQHFEFIHHIMHSLLGIGAFPLDSRLALLVEFAHCTDSFFHRGTTRFGEQLLSDAVDALANPQQLRQIHDNMIRFIPSRPSVLALIRRLLESPTMLQRARLRQLYAEIVTGSGGQAASTDDELHQRYVAGRDAWQGHFGKELDRMFGNYARNYLLAEAYTGSQNLTEYVGKLLLRIAALRFLLFSQPASPHALDGNPGSALENTAVRTFQVFSRGIDHNQRFLADLPTLLQEQDGLGLTGALNLIAF